MVDVVRQKVNAISDSWIAGIYIIALFNPLILGTYRIFENINAWQITEWLISYDGGFVRRGIGGEIVKVLSQYFELSPSIIIIFISVLAWLLLSLLISRLVKGFMPSYFVWSPIFLGMPVYSDFVVRKDVIGILILALALLALKKYDGLWRYILINFLIVFASLNHESFVFFGIPLVLLTDVIRSQKLYLFRFILVYLPSLLTTVFVLFYKGDANTANSIASFWNAYFEKNYPDVCCLSQQPAAIAAIGWTSWQGISLSLGLLDDFIYTVFYVPAIWFLTALLFMLFGSWIMNEHHGRRFVEVFMVQFFFVLPLFILGVDWGRWIFYISTSSLIWVSLFSESRIISGYFSRLLDIAYLKSKLSRKEISLIGLFFGLPTCCWNIKKAILSTPLGDNLYVIHIYLKSF